MMRHIREKLISLTLVSHNNLSECHILSSAVDINIDIDNAIVVWYCPAALLYTL